MDEARGPVALPSIGETIDRYVVVGEIARGGMAAVFAVRRTGVGGFEKLLALKIMLPHLASERHFVEMFLDEARLASQIDHPNVCRVLDVGTHRTVPYLLMELVHGRSFAAVDACAASASLEEPGRVAFWLGALAQAAEGLHAAHEARGADGESLGIVHRDVSPQNVILGFDGGVRVVDFGIAAGRGRLVGTRTGEIKGKLAYLAPEQVQRDQAISRATDLWGLGVVAWELFVGRPLFKDAEEAKVLWSVMSARVPEVAKLAPDLPAEAARVVMQCLERDVSQRPTDAREVARVLAEASARMGASALLPLARPEKMMNLLFPDARPAWAEHSAAAATIAAPGLDDAPRVPVRVAAAGTETGETVTLALPIAIAAPRSRGVARWLAPTLVVVAAVLAGAAISRSSSRAVGESARVDGSPDSMTSTPSRPAEPAPSVAASSAASASAAPPPDGAPSAPDPSASLEAPPSAPVRPAGPRSASAPRSSPTPSARPSGDARASGPLMSNPF